MTGIAEFDLLRDLLKENERLRNFIKQVAVVASDTIGDLEDGLAFGLSDQNAQDACELTVEHAESIQQDLAELEQSCSEILKEKDPHTSFKN